jgi:hypothetical protein
VLTFNQMRFRLHWASTFALAAGLLLAAGALVAQSQPPPSETQDPDKAVDQTAAKPAKKPSEPVLLIPAPMAPLGARSPLLPKSLAQPSTPDPSLAPAAAVNSSPSGARPLGPTESHSYTPQAAQATGAPPPLALPTPTPEQSAAIQAAMAAATTPETPLAPSAPAPPSLSQPSGDGRPASASRASGTRQATSAPNGRRLIFEQAAYDSPTQDAPYAVKVTMHARGVMHPASVVFLCTERVDHGAVPVPEGTKFKQLREGYANAEKTAYWLVFDEPALQSGDSFTIILMSARPVRVVNVQEGPSVK